MFPIESERSGDVNLVVHQQILERGIWEEMHTHQNPAYLDRMVRAMEEIHDVAGLPTTVFVDHFNPEQIPIDIGNAQNVMIFGCTRDACVGWASQAAMDAGAIVAVSIKGTV